MYSAVRRIVIAEDNPSDVLIIRISLQQEMPGSELAIFADGEQALVYIDEVERRQRPCPDLMLLDLNMPRVGGEEVLTRLRQCSVCSNIPVIILTSISDPDDKRRLMELGAAQYFEKPYDIDLFMTIGQLAKNVLDAHKVAPPEKAFATACGA